MSVNLIVGQPHLKGFFSRLFRGDLVGTVLLVGPEGVGKRFSTFLGIRSALCHQGNVDGCSCSSCFFLKQGCHPDVHWISPQDDKDIPVGSVRDVLDRIRLRPEVSKLRFVFLEHVDRMTDASANALLKTLEEPPSHVRFILTTERPDGVMGTIRSRCLEVPFRRLSDEFVHTTLKPFEPESSVRDTYVRVSSGCPGLALRLLSSGQLSCRDKVEKLFLALDQQDIVTFFTTVDETLKTYTVKDFFLWCWGVLSDILEGKSIRFSKVQVTKLVKSIEELEDLHLSMHTNIGYQIKFRLWSIL